MVWHQALSGITHPRRAMMTVAHSTWIQAVIPLVAELSIMFPAIYGPCQTEAWLGLPISWGPAKIYCSLSASEAPSPTFWVAVSLPELPVYSATTAALPPSAVLALPQLLWIPLLNFELYEWLEIAATAIHLEVPATMLAEYGVLEFFEPLVNLAGEFFRCFADCVFFASLLYTATIGRLMAVFSATLGGMLGLAGDLWLDFGHACLQFDSALLVSGLTEQSPSMIVM